MLQKFSSYGKLLEWCFPKDKEGVRKPFGFITYSSEEEAARAVREANGQDFSGRLLRVCYALERQSMLQPRSRSRSPIRTQVGLEAELRSKITELNRSSEEQKERAYKLLREFEDLRSRQMTIKTENDNLQRALSDRSRESEANLPCGHTKRLTTGQLHLYEGLVNEVLARLPPEQRQEELFTQTLRLRTYGILETQRQEYRCCRVLRCVLGDCGHVVNETCWQVRAMFLRKKPVYCPVLVQGLCVHQPKVECSKVQDPCRECFKFHRP